MAKKLVGRVRLSEAGVKALVTNKPGSKMHAQIEGTLMGVALGRYPKVLWDGYTTVYHYGPNFLELIE